MRPECFDQGPSGEDQAAFFQNLASNGAAIYNRLYNSASLTVSNSTFSTNRAAVDAGAIYNGRGSPLAVTNSTFSGNLAYYGGAIANIGTAAVSSSTLSDNAATNSGGAIYNYGTLTIGATILAGSTVNCLNGGTINDLGYNLSDDSSCGLSSASDLTNTNPMLGTLADNGGPTQTMDLLSGSPAIDQIPTSNPLCSPSSSDQRGQARPDELETECDIGAYTASVSPTPDGGTVSF